MQDTSTPAPSSAIVRRTVEECRELFVREQETIKAAVLHIARRHRLRPDETEELASSVNLKLIEDDYLVLRKFQGRASLHTYLVVVINRVFLDSRLSEWGKWRPSAVARREGAVAMLFEQLTTRRGYSIDEAYSELERTHGAAAVDRAALESLAGRLPARVRHRTVTLDVIEDIPSAEADPAAAYAAKERAATAARSVRALERVLRTLSPDDRSLLRRRMIDRATIADVAREQSRDARFLYRHVPRLLARLRRLMEEHGVSPVDVRES